MDSPAKPRVVVLLGTNYSGSHLLSHLTSAHSACLGVGELHRYQTLLATGGTAPVVSVYKTQPVFAGLENMPATEWHSVLSARFGEETGVAQPVIIDNSKKVKWVKRITDGTDYDVRLVHLIRDPRALVLRWLNTYDSEKRRRTQRMRVAKRMPARSPQILAGDWVTVFVYKWLRENRQISDFIVKRGLPHAVVTYHDMVFDTEAMLQHLMPNLGLDYEPGQLAFGENEHYGTVKTEHADAIKKSEIRPDLKWQTQLDGSAAAHVVSNTDVQKYLASLDLRCGEKGLVRL